MKKEHLIEVKNPKILRVDRLAAELVPMGKPGDYKPCVARIPGGELLVVAFHGNDASLDSGKYREDIVLFRSSDGGRSWSEGRVLEGLLGREPYLTVLRNGTLLITVHFLQVDMRNKDGYTYSYVHRSEDAGQTWTSTRVQPKAFPPGSPTWTTRNVLQLDDGSLLMGITTKHYSLGHPPQIWRSFDCGRTWPEEYPAQFPEFPVQHPVGPFNEAVLWQVRSGKIYAIWRVDHRHFPLLPGRKEPGGRWTDELCRMILFTSKDTGRTWAQTDDFGDYGEHYPAVLRLQDGRLLLTFTVRAFKDPLGVRAVVGEEDEDGFRFDFDHDRFMIDTKTPAGSESGGGFGRTIQLEDGTLVSSYSYRGDDNKTHLEVARWAIP